jgi:hypothetical protein
VDAQNVRARGIAAAVDAKDLPLAAQLSDNEAPLKILNEILRLSAIPIEVSFDRGEQLLASKSGSSPYSIAELSDGERNVLLLAANVLTAPPSTLLLIDEPERHIHRSISSRLLSQLFARRPDCAFAISTHDVMLCLDNPDAKVLLARSCKRASAHEITWDVDLLNGAPNLDERLVGDILGARRNVLFLEGKPQSLDQPLYSLLFPQASVVAKESCRDVEQAVLGVRAAEGLHWVRAFGIVDGDGRTPEDKSRLAPLGVHLLEVFSVESIYYDSALLERIAARQAAVTAPETKAVRASRRKVCARVDASLASWP